MTRIGEHGRMWAVLHRAASSNVLYANPPDWNEMTAWHKLLGPGALFVDVGSNVGSYALWAADCGAEVIAVEPSTAASALLRENVDLNDFPIRVIQCALADQRGEMTLTDTADTMNHLVVDGSGVGERVPAMTLDDLLDGRVAIGVKIDVEGCERLVLEGSRVSLGEGRIKVLQVEWNEMSRLVLGENREPVIALFAEFGYGLFRPDETGTLRPTDAHGYGTDVFAVASGYDAAGAW